MTELVERFRARVFGLCFRMLGNRQDAEDMTQEAFVRALRSLARFDPQRGFAPWLLAIAGNRCRSLMAVRMNKPRFSAEVETLPDPASCQDSGRALAEEVQRSLGELREEHRQAFLLFHDQQLSYLEIAEVMACPVGTVKTWVHRARRELAERLVARGVVEEMPNAMRRI